MTEKLLTKHGIAEALGTTPTIAAQVLEQHGVYPIDLGYGRSRGKRWLASAVSAALRDMSAEQRTARQKKSVREKAQPTNVVGLSSLSVSDIYALTQRHAVQ